MIILGIDPGLAIVGYSIVEYKDKQYKLLASGAIKTNQEDREEKRLLEIYEDICFLCEKYNPDVASIEKLYFFKNQKTVMQVSQARGVILVALEKYKISIYGYTPIEVKQTITGFGRASKNEVKKYVELYLELPNTRLDDTIDSIAIAICHSRQFINKQ